MDRPRLYALALLYARNTGPVKRNARAALLDAIVVNPDHAPSFVTPAGKRTVNDESRAVHAWIAAARRNEGNPDGKRGPRTDRPHRVNGAVSDATLAVLDARAAADGRTRSRVVGDILESHANKGRKPKRSP